jgi:nicotinamide-nucleotide amidase
VPVTGGGDTTLARAAELVAALRARRWLAATAESCTGGGVAQAITAIAGSSEVFDRGFVTYSNEAKVEMLRVEPALIEAHGAVSEAVAQAMARGALAASRADVAVAITGIAGPGGGTAAKPVGTVCFAWATRAGRCLARTRRLAGDRGAVRDASARIAIEGVAALAQDRAVDP